MTPERIDRTFPRSQYIDRDALIVAVIEDTSHRIAAWLEQANEDGSPCSVERAMLAARIRREFGGSK